MPDIRPDDIESPRWPTIDDLHTAIDWMGTYEGDEGDANIPALAAAMRYLAAHAQKMLTDQVTKDALKQAGITSPTPRQRSQARKAARQVLQDQGLI